VAGRFVFIVLDGVGVGALPDAPSYGDAGSDTLGNLSRAVDLHLPTFERLGLGNILPVLGVPPTAEPLCLTGRLAPLSAGKDTTVGHWEHMGLITEHPFPTYPLGFPEEVLAPFRAAIGRGVLGNKPASGTAIIAELGEEHLRDGWPIVYTSADSVFQIAAHTGVVPLELLYEWCETARSLLIGPHAVARVIARPFTGEPGSFTRTKDRRDFSLAPPTDTYLDLLHRGGVPVLALGKISEVFVGRGVTTKIKVANNDENLDLVSALVAGTSDRASLDEGLLFTNLVDFDMVWGHRNDVDGFAHGLEAVDAALPSLLAALDPGDRLILTADHGVDPTTPSTDHSREYVPMLFYPPPADAPPAVYDGSFSDTGATVFKYLTGKTPSLVGVDISDLRPGRGWRRFTPVLPVTGAEPERVPARAGREEAQEAAHWLAENLGSAPEAAVVLGSGLEPDPFPPVIAQVPYDMVPHWPTGTVTGHPCRLSLVEWRGLRVAILQGRLHEYEGYDLGEIQLPVRSMAAWGTAGLVVTSASGAVDETLVPGAVLAVGEILDCTHVDLRGRPTRLKATDDPLLAALNASGSIQASVPGPQYETQAELAVLRSLGAKTVSMSPAGEVRAAHDSGMRLLVLAVVANVGETTHEKVLAATAQAGRRLAETIAAALAMWASSPRPDSTPR